MAPCHYHPPIHVMQLYSLLPFPLLLGLLGAVWWIEYCSHNHSDRLNTVWVVMGKGFGNPMGIWVRVPWVRVRVHIWKPLENPYPCQGLGVTLGICHRFFIYTNLFLLLLLLYIYIWSMSTALPVDEMLIYWLMQYLPLHRMIIQWFGSNSALSCFLVFSSVAFFFFIQIYYH